MRGLEGLGNPTHDLAGSESGAGEPVAALLSRFQEGDTDAVGDFVREFGPVIRAHYRRRIGRAMQRLVDSQDLLSTIARRLCQRVSSRRVQASDHRQLWALVFRIGDGAMVDRMRIVARLRTLEADSSPFVHMLRERLDRPGDTTGSGFAEELSAMLESLANDVDRHLLVMWLHGQPLAQSGQEFGLTAAAARKRWERIRQALRSYLESRRLAPPGGSTDG